MQQQILLKTEKLCKTFSNGGQQQHVLKNIDLELYQGDFTVIMGASGAGKSTLLYALSGMDTPSLGTITFGNKVISDLSQDGLAVFRRDHCGFVFQQIYLIDGMSVMDNVLSAGLLVSKDKKALVAKAKELFAAVDISEETQKKFPTQISGGEAQRVGIVRALINSPEILFADEPTGALNSKTGLDVLNTLTQFNEQGQSVVMVTHDMRSARRGNRILYLKDGVILGECNLGKYAHGDTARHEKLSAFLKIWGGNMRKLFLIARANMRKAKGQTAAIVVLILLASMLLNLWLMLSMDYKANFDRYHIKLNAEHVTLLVNDTDNVPKFLSQTLENEPEVKEYCMDRCMYMVGTFPYNGGMMNGQFIFMDKQTALSRSIGKAEIVEEGKFTSGVYLPMLYKSDDFSVGKTIEITIGSHLVTYTVCGFFNSVMMGSHNCALTQIILTQDRYAELEVSNYAFQTTLCSVRLNEKSTNLTYEAKIKAIVSENFPNTQMASNCYDIVAQSRYISQGICSAIMSVMAFFVLLIALVVIVSNIINYIQVSIKNLGALKAAGYTSGQLVLSLLLQFLGLTFIAALVGAALSYALFPAINIMMIAQTGIPYAIHFLPLPALISLIILGGTVALSVWFSAHRIKKIEPIVALRSGVQTHNFKKNRVPLEKTKAPLNFALALKTTLSGVKHNITVCITMLVLSLVVVFSGLMTENIIVDMTPFLNLIVGETADSAINVQTEIEDDFLEVLNSDSRTEKAYLYNSLNVSHVGGVELMATLCDDFSKVNNQSVVFKGRFPKYDNEIAIAAKYAKEKGFAIGNEIEITANGKTEKYLISGFTQITNNLGRDCLLTRQGYERLGTLQSVTYYINLVEGTDIDAFNEEMKGKFSDSVNGVINVLATIEGVGSVYVSLITIIVIAILVLSAIIIAFVLYLLVRTMLNNKKRDYGILKSLGFTTKQLILQTALSFMPAIILSTVVGIIVSCLVINPLMSLFLSSMGIVKCTFSIPVAFSTLAGIGLIIISFGIACLLSLKIKKIAPRHLLVGE